MNKDFTIISGPCSFESIDQIDKHFNELDSQFLRAGIFKLRTAHESFQGLRSKGISDIRDLKEKYKFKFVSEIVSKESLENIAEITDIFQIGTRNMYNYELLKEVSKYKKKTILKRAFSATIDEWIKAGKYIDEYLENVILCERGIRTFEPSYRNTLDLNAVSFIKRNYGFNVIVDPSHGTGDAKMVEDLSLAALACGADGLLIETHFDPKNSISDANQALSLDQMNGLVEKLKEASKIFNKKVIF